MGDTVRVLWEQKPSLAGRGAAGANVGSHRTQQHPQPKTRGPMENCPCPLLMCALLDSLRKTFWILARDFIPKSIRSELLAAPILSSN